MANVPPIVICTTSISKMLPVNVTVIVGGIIIEQPADGICPVCHMLVSLKSPDIIAMYTGLAVVVIVVVVGAGATVASRHESTS